MISGDRGTRLFKTLRVAMAQPYSYMALSGYSEEAVDKARSRVLAALLRGVLAATEQGSRLAAVSAAATSILQGDGRSSSSVLLGGSINSSGGGSLARVDISSSSSSSGPQDTAEHLLLLPRANLDVTPALAHQAAALHATVLGTQHHHPHSSSSGSVSSAGGWLPAVQQAVPGLPLQQQPVHTRLQVVVLLQVLQVLKAWGVGVQHDAALAAALQVLRFCWDTEDARQSGADSGGFGWLFVGGCSEACMRVDWAVCICLCLL